MAPPKARFASSLLHAARLHPSPAREGRVVNNSLLNRYSKDQTSIEAPAPLNADSYRSVHKILVYQDDYTNYTHMQTYINSGPKLSPWTWARGTHARHGAWGPRWSMCCCSPRRSSCASRLSLAENRSWFRRQVLLPLCCDSPCRFVLKPQYWQMTSPISLAPHNMSLAPISRDHGSAMTTLHVGWNQSINRLYKAVLSTNKWAF